MDTLAGILSCQPASAALILADGPTITRAHLNALIANVAARLQASGIGKGDVVSIAMTNTIDYVVTFLAVTWARAVAAPLNSDYKVDEFKFFLNDAKSKLLIVPSKGNKAGETAAAALGVPIATLDMETGTAAKLAPRLTPKSGRLSSSFQAAGLTAKPLPSDIALFLHTSGTTSRPKGVPLSHANLVSSVSNIIATYQLTPRDTSYLVMPLFHVHGLMAGLLAPLAAGGAVVLPSAGKFSASHFWPDCCRYGVTFYTAVPTIHQVLLARADKDYPASSPPPLRFIRSCSASLAPATLERLEAAFKVPVLEAYAMTEASHQMTSNPLPSVGPRKPGSVGLPQGSVRVAVLDGCNKLLPAGQIGEVCIQGPNVTAGYLNNPTANVEAYGGGWFHTGDQGWLDREGYLTLTGRLKELINRGGEKISPLEVDGILLSHPLVAEAVSFGAPDEKYGEVVAAAVVLKAGTDGSRDVVDSIRQHCADKLAAFKVPNMIFPTQQLPKTATGKIQRRLMVDAFIKGEGAQQGAAASGGPPPPPQQQQQCRGESRVSDGYRVVAESLAALGVRHMFGVIGIPVTQLASAAQAAGIRFLSFRNEQAAGYAAAAAGYLTRTPGVLLTVSGPGAIHGIAGLSHAMVNGWPLIMISGSAPQEEVGKGAFQECDQVSAVKPFTKYATSARALTDIPIMLRAACTAATSGRPGAAYVDLPSNVLMSSAASLSEIQMPAPVVPEVEAADGGAVGRAAGALRGARRPLVVVGEGAAYAGAEKGIQQLVNRFGLPLLSTSTARGLLPDIHPLCVNAARSHALKGADVVLVVGARLNWQLHFGEPPRWSPTTRFLLIDSHPTERDRERAEEALVGSIPTVLQQLLAALDSTPGVTPTAYQAWVAALQEQATAASQKLEVKLQATAHPLDYYTALRVLRGALEGVQPAPIVVSEGANTMDNARLVLRVWEPRTRLDAGAWGTMGVGLGSAIAAAVTHPGCPVVAVEGDSAFGFSMAECETIVRYKLPIVVIVFNNGGIYGGDRREAALKLAAAAGAKRGGFASDPTPTDFVPGSRYEVVMQAFGGYGVKVDNAMELAAECEKALASGKPALLNVTIDPSAGAESGNVHSFNAPKGRAKL